MKDTITVLLSGGQDSITCLHWTLRNFKDHPVRAVMFNYDQTHRTEIYHARNVCDRLELPTKIFSLGFPESQSSLIVRDDFGGSLPHESIRSDGLPASFVPGRNLVFLTYAAAYASTFPGTIQLVTGVCQTDYSGYPDCRSETIQALEAALSFGIRKTVIHTPLMHLSKADTVKLAIDLGVDCIRDLVRSVTCYNGRSPGCGHCPSCLLRKKGFDEAGVIDPSLDNGHDAIQNHLLSREQSK